MKSERFNTPVFSRLVLQHWGGTSSNLVITTGTTPKKFRIKAIVRTRLGGRNRWIEAGEEALVPKTSLRHGSFSVAATSFEIIGDTLYSNGKMIGYL